MNRVSFIIEGFNLYHSLKAAQKKHKIASTRWLDLYSLCSAHLHHFGKDAKLYEVYYISALATHLEASKPDVTKRHKDYISCLEDTGVIAEMNRFKRKDIRCKRCNRSFFKYEEKETDVLIATKLLELLYTDKCDTAVLVTGDTDMTPAVRTGLKLFPEKKILFAFPFGTKTRELTKLAPGSFTLGKATYGKHQFPDPFILSDGTTVGKPPKW